MAKTTNHVATHNGFTFTRGSKTRHYSHLVIQRESMAADRLQSEAWARESFRRNLPYYTELANGIHKLADKYPGQYTPEKIAKEQADAQAEVAMGEDGAASRAMKLFDANRAAYQLEADGDTFYTVVGWTSRLDLAHSQAKGSPARIILPVVVV